MELLLSVPTAEYRHEYAPVRCWIAALPSVNNVAFIIVLRPAIQGLEELSQKKNEGNEIIGASEH
jgi:hypothetical protein